MYGDHANGPRFLICYAGTGSRRLPQLATNEAEEEGGGRTGRRRRRRSGGARALAMVNRIERKHPRVPLPICRLTRNVERLHAKFKWRDSIVAARFLPDEVGFRATVAFRTCARFRRETRGISLRGRAPRSGATRATIRNSRALDSAFCAPARR